MDEIKTMLKVEWEMTDLGEPSKMVSIKITQTDRTITISQKKYIENILAKEGLENANPVSTPLDQNITLEPNPDKTQGNKNNSYARLLGKL
jgi:tRNA(Ser,Leu) C12 N-acetylase TAN1